MLALPALADLTSSVVQCSRCPRLVEWRENAAREKPSRYAGWEYWARPVPGFGDPEASVVVIGLAPAAHGGNRTGRMFTGDRSGDWLFGALHLAGFANQATSRDRNDGLRLTGTHVTAVVRCAPPANRPLPSERDNCLPYLIQELVLLKKARVLVCLGSYAWDEALRAIAVRGHKVRPRPRFTHGAQATAGPYVLLGSYHPSQQNTLTGRLTRTMLDEVFERARTLVAQQPEAAEGG